MQLEAKVGAKGQVVIPKPLRKANKIMPGDRVLFRQEDKKIVIERPSVEEIMEFFRKMAAEINHKGKIDVHKYYDEMMEEKYGKLFNHLKK